jgi:hypothetical protein
MAVEPILITGAHRTGTTWVGKMLAAGGQAGYISEPLNVLHRPGVLRTPVKYWYTYIHEANEAEFLPGLLETISYRYHLYQEIKSLHSTKDLARMGRDWFTFLRGRMNRQIPLLKDPFAIFSAPWFAQRFGCRVVITIRHPAAFTSSLKRLQWPFDFSDLLAQPELMRDWLEPFRQEMQNTNPADSIASASLLWLMIYTFVHECVCPQDTVRPAGTQHLTDTQHPAFIIAKHEDLSADPVQGFKALYTQLGLTFTPRAEKKILQASSSENPGELARGATHSVRLNSRQNLQNWKRRLTPEEIKSIRDITGHLCEVYYPDQTWD